MSLVAINGELAKIIQAQLSHKQIKLAEKPLFFGIRNDSNPNTFNDIVGIIYKSKYGVKLLATTGTTDPGLPWILKPMKLKGCAILAEGYHKDIWSYGYRSKLGPFKNIPVMAQTGSAIVYRDKNKDGIAQTYEFKESGRFGIQFHLMTALKIWKKNQYVGRWSAGCQGTDDYEAYFKIMGLIKEYEQKTGKKNKYDNFLFNASDKSIKIPKKFYSLISQGIKVKS